MIGRGKINILFVLVCFFLTWPQPVAASSFCVDGENFGFSDKKTPAEVGAILAERVREKYPVIKDEMMVKRVREVFARLVAVVEKNKDSDYRIDVLNTAVVDACVFPGGFVFLSRGMLELLDTDEELAVIIAHELAHEVRGRIGSIKENRIGFLLKEKSFDQLSFLQEITALLRGEEEKIKDPSEVVRLEKEREADHYGLFYAHLAGFEPVPVMKRVLEKIIEARFKDIFPNSAGKKTVSQKMIGDMADQIEAYEAGVNLYRAGKYDSARISLNYFLKSYPGPEVYYYLGLTYYQLYFLNNERQNNYPFFCSLDLERLSPSFSIFSGKSALSEGYMENALDFLTKAGEIDPENKHISLALSCIYLYQNKPMPALLHLKKVEIKGGKEVEVKNNRGIARLKLGDPEQATKLFLEAIEKDPSYLPAAYNLDLMRNDPDKPAFPIKIRPEFTYKEIKEGLDKIALEKIIGKPDRIVTIKPLLLDVNIYPPSGLRIVTEGGYVSHGYQPYTDFYSN